MPLSQSRSSIARYLEAKVTGMVLPRNSGLTALMRSHISLTDALVEARAFRSCLTISNCAERLFSQTRKAGIVVHEILLPRIWRLI